MNKKGPLDKTIGVFVLWVCLFAFLPCAIAQTNVSKKKPVETSSQKSANELIDHIIKADSYGKDVYKPGKEVTYPVNAEQFDRFKNSPCWGKLGYSPYNSNLRKQYCDCENKYYWSLFWKILGGAVLLGVVGYMILLSRKKKKSL